MIEKIEGLIAAPLTGYHPDGSVNLDIVSRYAAMLRANGVVGVFVNGTTGEGMSLTVKERCDLAECWVDAAPEGLRVIVHIGHTCQIESQAMAVHAAKIGADAIGEMGPIFFRPTTVEALADYIAVTAGAAPELPFYYYHIPSMSHVLFSMSELMERVTSVVPNFKGIKYTHDDLDDFERCLRFADGKYDILFGRDEMLLEGLRRGAHGAVGSTYNIMASLYQDITKAFLAGEELEAQRLQTLAGVAIDILYNTGSFGFALKTVLGSIGLDLGGMRRPQRNLSEDEARQLEASLHETGVQDFLNRNDGE